MRILAPLLALLLLAAACGDDDDQPVAAADPTAAAETVATAEPDPTATPVPEPAEPADEPAAEELYPDVLAVEASLDPDGTWTFRTTLSSPYDTPQRYADAWRVLDTDGNELGVRVLTHDHANEQPFTRSLSNVAIPDDVTVVTVEGRDQVSGWGGATVEVELER